MNKILNTAKEKMWEEMGRNERWPTYLGYILETLLGLRFNSTGWPKKKQNPQIFE